MSATTKKAPTRNAGKDAKAQKDAAAAKRRAAAAAKKESAATPTRNGKPIDVSGCETLGELLAKVHEETGRLANSTTDAILKDAGGLGSSDPVTDEQRKRSTEISSVDGLRGKALGVWIITGEGTQTQVDKAAAKREERERAAKQEKTTEGAVRRSSDPEATELAAAAKKLAPDFKSAITPAQSRRFLDMAGRKDVLKWVGASKKAIAAFAVKSERTDETRPVVEWAKKTGKEAGIKNLYGRKLALLALAKLG